MLLAWLKSIDRSKTVLLWCIFLKVTNDHITTLLHSGPVAVVPPGAVAHLPMLVI